MCYTHDRSRRWSADSWVISDRFVDSMIVYQGHGQGAGLAVLERLSALSLEEFEPDLTVCWISR